MTSQDAPRLAHPIEGVMNAFEVVPLVALGEVHMLREEADLLTELATTPAFPDRVDTIVVEFGNALYQSTIDRYVAGEPVGRDELRRVWAETVGGMYSRVFESPIYEEFFVAVRQRNGRLSRDRRIRVLLGDPPSTREAPATRRNYGNREKRRSLRVRGR